MKKIVSALLFVVVAQFSIAQNCSNPISQAVFQSGFNQVAVLPSNDAKLVKAMSLF